MKIIRELMDKAERKSFWSDVAVARKIVPEKHVSAEKIALGNLALPKKIAPERAGAQEKNYSGSVGSERR